MALKPFTFHHFLSSIQDNLDCLCQSPPDRSPQIRSPKKKTSSPERNRHCLATRSYEQPTVASLSRSPSPYTKRRMCELAKIRQRLAHLNLGPFEFRKETDRPPFVIRRVCTPYSNSNLSINYVLLFQRSSKKPFTPFFSFETTSFETATQLI